ncbi:MAG: transposase family protein, partial [Flammeovirgaceae bacterium]
MNSPTINASWRIRKYYMIKSPLSMAKKLYYSAGILIADFGYNAKTLRNGISKFATGASKFYQSFRDGGAIMIDHDSVPKNSRGKNKLPANAQAAYDKLVADNKLVEDINKEAEFKQLKQTLEDLYHNKWPRYLSLYEHRIKDRDKRILFAKAHSLVNGILTCMKSKWPSRILFEAFRQIMVDEIDGPSEPVFYTFSYVYFLRKLSLCRTKGIPETLVHEMMGEPREYRRKMTGQVIAFIRLLFRNPRRFTVSAIIKKVSRKYNVILSPSTVKTLKSKSLDRNVLEYDANGVIYSRQNGLPKIIRFLAEAAGDQFQGDWYKLQFFCKRNGIIIRLWAYVVLDVYSKKVVGWALADKPSATQAKNAFKMAFKDHSFLPEEIVIDNDPIYKRSIFKRFCIRLNNLGVITTKAYANIPTWKAEIESFFAVLQKLHSDKPWYFGEDVKSKNE